MAVKTYEMQMLGYESTFPVMVGSTKTYISFKKASLDEGEGYLHTDKKEIQQAIEASNKFKNEEIKLIGTSGEEDEDGTTGEVECKDFADVKDWQAARDILLREPYNIAPQAVAKTPEAILKKASELGVTFSNLVNE